MRCRSRMLREGVGWEREEGAASDERVVGLGMVVVEVGTDVPAKCCSRAPGKVGTFN